MYHASLIEFSVPNMLIVLMLFIAIPAMIGVYVYRDAARRNMNAAVWTAIALLAPFLAGFIVYLIVRGSYTNLKCPSCGFATKADWTVCPKCAVSLSEYRM